MGCSPSGRKELDMTELLTLSLFRDSLIVVLRLSHPEACGILVLQLGIEPRPLAVRALTTGPPGDSLDHLFKIKVPSHSPTLLCFSLKHSITS